MAGDSRRCDEDSEDDDDDDCDDSDCSSEYDDADPDAGERRHFLDVCWSFVDYPRDAAHDLARLQAAINELDNADLSLWNVDPSTWLNEMQWRAEANSKFLRLLPVPEVCGADLGPESERTVRELPPAHRVASRNSSKVRSTLHQFVRDWAREGELERAASYLPLIQALQRHRPPGRGPPPTVLCPGCGLGRLPFELARCGYAAQGNEFSYHMLLGSHLILNRCTEAECHTIYPFALTTSNRKDGRDHLRAVKVPDLCPRTALPPRAELSMAAGEFIEAYNGQIGAWDAVATCFFLDTAKNVFLYIRTIAQLIHSGGIWTNIGPLLYHYADAEQEISIELSWEEVRQNICRYFDIIEERILVSQYAANTCSLTGVRYRCVHFVAVRNTVPPTGTSHPVF
mmetsp:Transcript_117026/g.342759  ORF Transcript_117026/g.342759 Transcript_117026/m.342759 type:complete len:399 (+) Transcript_117026:49-1245(+)